MLLCMSTNFRIDDHLLIEFKQYAARTGQTLTAVMEDALRKMLNNQQQPEERDKIKLLTVLGNGTLPGVDLDDSASLTELMEESDAAD